MRRDIKYSIIQEETRDYDDGDGRPFMYWMIKKEVTDNKGIINITYCQIEMEKHDELVDIIEELVEASGGF